MGRQVYRCFSGWAQDQGLGEPAEVTADVANRWVDDQRDEQSGRVGGQMTTADAAR